MAAQGCFLIAAERARLSFPDGKWESLTVSEQSDAIYRELRLIDADVMSERLAVSRSQQTVSSHPATITSHRAAERRR